MNNFEHNAGFVFSWTLAQSKECARQSVNISYHHHHHHHHYHIIIMETSRITSVVDCKNRCTSQSLHIRTSYNLTL